MAYLSVDTRNHEDRKTSVFLLADFLLGGLDVTPSLQISGNTTGSQGCLFSTHFVSLCNATCLKPFEIATT